MNKKQVLFLVLAIVAAGASIAMYLIGSDSSHLSELLDFWYYPIPLAVISIVGIVTAKKS